MPRRSLRQIPGPSRENLLQFSRLRPWKMSRSCLVTGTPSAHGARPRLWSFAWIGWLRGFGARSGVSASCLVARGCLPRCLAAPIRSRWHTC